MSEALEITTFRLVSGLSGADFVDANEDINDHLRRQPGFRWRRIVPVLQCIAQRDEA